MSLIVQTHYDIISSFYGDVTSTRSEVPLINHIIEGLQILTLCGASDYAKAAYCIHPILQSDYRLTIELQSYYEIQNNSWIGKIDPFVLVLAMEYRHVANSFLCNEYTDRYTSTDLDYVIPDPSKDIKDMLIADKIQNQKDFLSYHKKNHPRSAQLERYFIMWLNHLKVTPEFIGNVYSVLI